MILNKQRRIHLHNILDQLLDETDLDHGILFIREVQLADGDQVHAISVSGIVGKESQIVRDLVAQIRKKR